MSDVASERGGASVSEMRSREASSGRTLLDDLAGLAGLIEPDQRDDITDLIARLCDNRFRILVIGEAKRG